MKDTPVTRVWFWFEQVGQDVRIALRTIRRDRIFALAAVSTLALGIGATTAIFDTANAALLRPASYPDWQDIRTVRTAFTDGNLTSGLVAPVEVTRMNDPALPIVRAVASLRRDATLLLNDDSTYVDRYPGGDARLLRVVWPAERPGSGVHRRALSPWRSPWGRPRRLWRKFSATIPPSSGRAETRGRQCALILTVAARDMAAPADTDGVGQHVAAVQGTAHSFEGYLRVRPRLNPEALRAARDDGRRPGP